MRTVDRLMPEHGWAGAQQQSSATKSDLREAFAARVRRWRSRLCRAFRYSSFSLPLSTCWPGTRP